MKLLSAAAASATVVGSAEAVATLQFLGRVARDVPSGGVLAQDVDAQFEVVKTEAFKADGVDECICPAGTFWHYRIKECITKGGVGYECGFFPGEHHEKVCQDGLTCKKLDQTVIKYFHEGAIPASCQPCQASDNCKKDSRSDCAKAISLSGEACVTVRVTATPKVGVPESESESHTASATATAKAEATATYGEGDKAVTKTASAECTESATASATASSVANGQEQGSSEQTACVSIVDALTRAGHSRDLKFGESIAAEVQAAGQELALERAKAAAQEAAAQQASKKSAEAAQTSAGKDAGAKAQQQAQLQAEAEAKKKAEACAKEKAQLAAEAAAKAAYQNVPAPTTTVPTTTTPAPVVDSTVAATPEPTQAPEPLLPSPPAKKIEPAQEPTIPPRRKVPKEDVAAELP